MRYDEADRVALAERAATAIATRYDLAPEHPRVLHHSNNVVLHLAPAPIVAKVGTSIRRPGAHASLTRELEVGRFLAARHAPIVRPASGLPAGPHCARGATVTFWDYCDHQPRAEADAGSAGHALAELHSSLAGYDGALPPFTDQIGAAARVLDRHPLPGLTPGERAFLDRTHDRLSVALAAHRPAVRPLHGDVHVRNVLVTGAGSRWIDFEAACLGPIEWDLAGLGDDALEQHPSVDGDLLELMGELRSLCVTVWCSMNPDRAPELSDAARHHLSRLRARG